MYLDNRTGDFYEASKGGQWELGGNVGLHWVSALGPQSEQVKKTPIYIKKIQKYQPIL